MSSWDVSVRRPQSRSFFRIAAKHASITPDSFSGNPTSLRFHVEQGLRFWRTVFPRLAATSVSGATFCCCIAHLQCFPATERIETRTLCPWSIFSNGASVFFARRAQTNTIKNARKRTRTPFWRVPFVNIFFQGLRTTTQLFIS